MEHVKLKTGIISATLVSAAAIAYFYYRKSRKQKEIPLRKAVEAFDYLKIDVVTANDVKCDSILKNIKSGCEKHHAIGFDCEWVTSKSGRQPVSLLQLSTFDGYCVLFRLHLMESIPQALIDILTDHHIYKVGVAPLDDAKYLQADYGIPLQGTLDVRHFVQMCGEGATGLGAMSQIILHVTLDKTRKTRCSNWEAPDLSPAQLHYAASDAHAAILIFVKSMDTLNRRRRLWNPYNWSKDIWERIHEECDMYADLTYKIKHVGNKAKNGMNINSNKEKKLTSNQDKNLRHPVRKRPLYDNCYLLAPDGELLCTCDTRKALWYVDKQLADVVTASPMTVKLRFEPAGRSVGAVGRYYQTEKQNKCVVCGLANTFIRKNIVPREYRKFFPDLMKDHSSHDVLLLCVSCHRRSNAADQTLRDRLAERCDAPLKQNKQYVEEPRCKSIRMAARALLVHGRKHVLPEERRKELESVVLQYYPDQDTVTDELLEEAANLSTLEENRDYNGESHGTKVVAYFMNEEGGLLALETLWRQHFLDVMHPQYLPELWSVTHNEERLFVKYSEGRINDEDLKSIGLKNVKWKVNI